MRLGERLVKQNDLAYRTYISIPISESSSNIFSKASSELILPSAILINTIKQLLFVIFFIYALKQLIVSYLGFPNWEKMINLGDSSEYTNILIFYSDPFEEDGINGLEGLFYLGNPGLKFFFDFLFLSHQFFPFGFTLGTST